MSNIISLLINLLWASVAMFAIYSVFSILRGPIRSINALELKTRQLEESVGINYNRLEALERQSNKLEADVRNLNTVPVRSVRY